MSISVGDRIPSLTLKTPAEGGIQDVALSDLFAGKKAILFAVPGAFTPACSDYHLPSYVDHVDDLRARGVELIACTAVNDAFVLGAWAKERSAGDKVTMLADGNGELAKALGMELDASGFGLGTRSKRYALVLQDGVVQSVHVEASPGEVAQSGAAAVLESL